MPVGLTYLYNLKTIKFSNYNKLFNYPNLNLIITPKHYNPNYNNSVNVYPTLSNNTMHNLSYVVNKCNN